MMGDHFSPAKAGDRDDKFRDEAFFLFINSMLSKDLAKE
jgi:hypothetical protein